MSLGRGPDGQLAVRFDPRRTRLGFHIALMDHLGGVGLFQDDIGLLETGLRVAVAVHHVGGDIARLGRLFLGRLFGRVQVFMHQRGVGLHGLQHVADHRQLLVLDLDHLGRLLGRKRIGGGHRGHGLAVIAGLVRGHDQLADGAHVDADLADQRGGRALGQGRQIVGADDGFDPGQGQGLAGIDLFDPGVAVGAADQLGPQHIGQAQIGAKGGLAGHPFRTIDLRQTRANNRVFCHIPSPHTGNVSALGRRTPFLCVLGGP